MASHPNATICYYKSNMILNIHSDASYLSEPNARSRVAGHFFVADKPDERKPILLNDAVHTLCMVLKHVAASAAEAELGGLFSNAGIGLVLRLTFQEMGHPQPTTTIYTDNSTAAGIPNNTVKRQRSRAMDMRYFWTNDQDDQGNFKVEWIPGTDCMADYPSKHHQQKIHKQLRKYYVHEEDSPRYLYRSKVPSALRGCVETQIRKLLLGINGRKEIRKN